MAPRGYSGLRRFFRGFFFRDREIAESTDLDENAILDLDMDGNILAMTFEHASTRTDLRRLTVEGIAA